jgi:hypothetical protein
MRTNRQCTLVCVAVGCVLLMALCIWLLVYTDAHEKGAWLLGLLLPSIVVLCCAFAVLSYAMVHLICPADEGDEGDAQEMTFVENDEDATFLVTEIPPSLDESQKN